MAWSAQGHEIIVALNGALPTPSTLRQAFDGLPPMDQIRVATAAGHCHRRGLAGPAERIREGSCQLCRPTWSTRQHVRRPAMRPSPAAACSRPLPTAVTVFDLIPVRQTPYLLDNPAVRAHYLLQNRAAAPRRPVAGHFRSNAPRRCANWARHPGDAPASRRRRTRTSACGPWTRCRNNPCAHALGSPRPCHVHRWGSIRARTSTA